MDYVNNTPFPAITQAPYIPYARAASRDQDLRRYELQLRIDMMGNILLEVLGSQLLVKPAQNYLFQGEPGLSEAQYSIYSERPVSNATFVDMLGVPTAKQDLYTRLPLLEEPNNHNSFSRCKDEEALVVSTNLPSITTQNGPNPPSLGSNLYGINYRSLADPQHPSPSQYSDPSSTLISGDNYFNEGQDEANCFAQQSNQVSLGSNACSITHANHPLISSSITSNISCGFASANRHELPCLKTYEQCGSAMKEKKNDVIHGDGVITHEKKKRKRTRSRKNSEEMESQRMTHIAVERNRRRQMNEHLSALRSLMPSSYIQRGDQASIVGGAIRFVEELEQVLQSLRLQKQLRGHGDESSHAHLRCLVEDVPYFRPHFGLPFSNLEDITRSWYGLREESYACSKSPMANVEVKIFASSAIFVKVLAQKKPRQLFHTLSALSNLYLKVMHLNITTIELTILYSFNLEMEDECQLQTPNDLAQSIQHIFDTCCSQCL